MAANKFIIGLYTPRLKVFRNSQLLETECRVLVLKLWAIDCLTSRQNRFVTHLNLLIKKLPYQIFQVKRTKLRDRHCFVSCQDRKHFS